MNFFKWLIDYLKAGAEILYVIFYILMLIAWGASNILSFVGLLLFLNQDLTQATTLLKIIILLSPAICILGWIEIYRKSDCRF